MREPAVEPYAQTKPAWWMVRELGVRLGLEDFFKWKTAEEYLNLRLSSIGLNLDKLREQNGITLQPGKPWLADFEKENGSPFATESGKVELYAASLEKAKLKPMPEYEATASVPAGFFRLLYGRSPVHTFSRTTNTPVLNELMSENEVWVNDEAAAGLGLKNGDRVMLENQDGVKSGPIKVKATPRIRKDAVFMVHGFGHDAPGLTRANKRGASDAMLQTQYVLDPISGGAGLRVNFVKLTREA
jgi:thiosulfate reductase/polysulfide reductase chain A